MSEKEWRSRWEYVRDLGQGGHGHAKLVRDKSTGTEGVLKTLHENGQQERRDRLHNEAIVLQALDHDRLPKLLDHNVEYRADKNVQLYIVTEFIPGRDLSKITNSCSLEDALICVEAIVDTVEYCHTRNVRHRDLKPNNVVLRNDNIRDPFVIDFGQSFNEHEAAIQQTEVGDGLGNRCMHLPELQPGSADKRSELTDISFCAGIFFWLLTRHCPRELGRDHNGKYPYEREPAISIIAAFPEAVRNQLIRFFAMGLARGFDQRIPSIDSFREKLAAIREPSAVEGKESLSESLKRALRDIEDDPSYQFEQRTAALQKALWKSVAQFAKDVTSASDLKIRASAQRLGTQRHVFHTSIRLEHLELRKSGGIRITGEISDANFVISGSPSFNEPPTPMGKVEFWEHNYQSEIERIVNRAATELVRQWLLPKPK